jgi:hypothetical protein
MPEFVVVVKVTAGYLVKVNAESPEQAAETVRTMKLQEVQRSDFFVNTNRMIGTVWNALGDVVWKGRKQS